MPAVTQAIRDDVTEIVYDFFSEECEIDRKSIHSESDILGDLHGDSLMFLELMEIFKKKYGMEVNIQSIGLYMLKHPAETVGKVIDFILQVIEHQGRIDELD